MKHVTTLATVAFLAVASWAAPLPGATPASSSPLAGAPQGTSAAAPSAACPTPAAPVAPSKRTWKHGRPEYNAFTAAAGATNNVQKAQLAAAFVQKYPDSDYKDQALQMEMGAQAATPSLQAKAVATAEQLIKSPTAEAAQLLPAYTIVAYLDPTLVQAGDPAMAAKMAQLTQAATCGQQLLTSAPAAQQAQFGPILSKALGFAQLNTKHYGEAIATLSKVAQQNPKDPLVYYWMGIAQVTKSTPDFNTGLFDLARASVLAPQTAAFKSYLTTVYTSYHGAADGLSTVLTAATNNTTVPAGFKVMSKVDVENAAAMAQYEHELEVAKNTLPPANSFPGIEARLKRADLAPTEWKSVKGQGYELTGTITALTAKTVDIAVGATGANATPNVRLVLAAPLVRRPRIGASVTFDGVATSYRPNPPDPNTNFLLIMSEGSVKGFSPTAAAPAK